MLMKVRRESSIILLNGIPCIFNRLAIRSRKPSVAKALEWIIFYQKNGVWRK